MILQEAVELKRLFSPNVSEVEKSIAETLTSGVYACRQLGAAGGKYILAFVFPCDYLRFDGFCKLKNIKFSPLYIDSSGVTASRSSSK